MRPSSGRYGVPSWRKQWLERILTAVRLSVLRHDRSGQESNRGHGRGSQLNISRDAWRYQRLIDGTRQAANEGIYLSELESSDRDDESVLDFLLEDSRGNIPNWIPDWFLDMGFWVLEDKYMEMPPGTAKMSTKFDGMSDFDFPARLWLTWIRRSRRRGGCCAIEEGRRCSTHSTTIQRSK
jgi:hypothetical protein